MPNWLNNNWKNGSVKHIDKWKHIMEMLDKLNKMNVQLGFLHVRSHRKEPNVRGSYNHFLWYGNKCADMLATGNYVPRPKNDDIFNIL